MTTEQPLRPIDDVEHIRRLLKPERAETTIPPDRPHTRGTLDRRRYVDYPPQPWGSARFPVPEDVADRVRLARARHEHEARTMPARTPRGLPTEAERRERTIRALDWLTIRTVDLTPQRSRAFRRDWTGRLTR